MSASLRTAPAFHPLNTSGNFKRMVEVFRPSFDRIALFDLATYLIWPLLGSITNLVVAPLFTTMTS
jgi:hypothetical protein